MKQETPSALAFLDDAIAEARRHDLLRDRPAPPPPGRISFCSNDYLGLAARPAPSDHAGAGASRLVDGERAIHGLLEADAAALVQQPAALAFTSGYAANSGVLAALAGPGDVIVSDSLNHASLIDGARLSRARVEVVPHLDVAAIDAALRAPRAGRAFVVTESYFSMDADSPDVRALRATCDAHGAALVVDEAHALGVLGPEGRGLCVEAGVRADVVIGTFGKAFGAAGAFVAGCPSLVTWLWNRARPFVFSTGLSPVVAAAALEGLRTSLAHPELRHAVRSGSQQLRAALTAAGVRLAGYGHIVPWILGRPADALAAASALAAHGIDVRPIRPPSVPAGTSRLRLTITALHTEADLHRLASAVERVARELGECPGA